MLENPNLFFTFRHSFDGYRCFFFLISVKDVIFLSILDSILTFFVEKSIVHQLFPMPDGRYRYRSGTACSVVYTDPGPDPDRQNNADPIRSGSTTLIHRKFRFLYL
jgi:hypothetical protein